MKKFGLILAGCLAFIGLCSAHAEDIGDVARAATRRAQTVSTRQTTNSTANSRSNTTQTQHTSQNIRGRTTTRTNNVAERTNTTQNARPAANIVPRTTTQNVSTRTTTPRTATRTVTRTDSIQNLSTRKSRTISRTATNNSTRDDVLSRNYSKCKSVFFDCMDEFCANKDSQLKRCACSVRVNEFDAVKKQLAAVEDKMLDFNQRLLTVSMDKEDAAALSVATEGETAFLATTDKSDSKKTLDEIAKKLNTSFDTSKFNTDLNVLTWSLNADSAFDTVDSLMGASTTTKTGTALYSAALPVCREMAMEVCTESDLDIAENGYMAAIEQDCNTVAKTYKTQTDAARAKVLEGSALLDMSRLSIYQKRNSDDILTCKKKMLDKLTNPTVCGDNLGKCLDVTGQYIDPSTGEAFLTTELVNLGNLLKRPTDNYTWSTVPSNSTFVTFLNSKRKFLEPAMEQCQDIADVVWNEFMDDALAQIKLAQTSKLETVRQSCTTLTTQCLSDAMESITDFDARALATFGISADITANAMCADILDSCTALLEYSDGGNDWTTGMAGITTDTTYETMMQTCRQVGQACIIQVCKSTSGNFGLCESIASSTNRKAIINRTACWDEVKDCIRSAGNDAIEKFLVKLGAADKSMQDLNFYADMYAKYDSSKIIKEESTSDNTNIKCADVNTADATNVGESECVYDLCINECRNNTATLSECRICRLAEKLWGNCEALPTTNLTSNGSHNMIKQPNTSVETLLHWFAVKTGTDKEYDSCRDTTCGIGYFPVYENGRVTCISEKDQCFEKYNSTNKATSCQLSITNNGTCQCCGGSSKDDAGNCCENGAVTETVITGNCPQSSDPNVVYSCTAPRETTTYCASTDPDPQDPNALTSQIITQQYSCNNDKQCVLICDGGTMGVKDGDPYCSGTLVEVVIDNNNIWHYHSPTNSDYVGEAFMSNDGKCSYNYDNDNPSNSTWNTNSCINLNLKNWSVIIGDNVNNTNGYTMASQTVEP